MFIFITLTLLNIFIGLTGEVYGVMYAKSSFIWLKEVNDLMEEDLLKGKGLKSKASQWKKWGEDKERERELEKIGGFRWTQTRSEVRLQCLPYEGCRGYLSYSATRF